MAREAEKKGYHVMAIMNERDFEMVKKTLADGALFPTETVAQAYAESIGKNYYLPTVTASFDPSVVFAKPMPQLLLIIEKLSIRRLTISGKRAIEKLVWRFLLTRATQISATATGKSG